MSINVEKALTQMGFVADQNGYSLELPTRYKIAVVQNNNRFEVDYGPDIQIEHRSITNLSKPENIVVLECVHRLLRKGYSPKHIVLEKTWPLGHNESGRLDILLKDLSGHAYALVECKTWGEEYGKERNKMLEDGGQLFSYFVQERQAKMLYLYASKFDEDRVIVQTEYVDTTQLLGSNHAELFSSWDRTFIPNGIFADDAELYSGEYRPLKKGQLKELDADSGKAVFLGFLDILRLNAVSDKSNAFNKIFNLFVCKIIDEDIHAEDEEVDFQWKSDDTPTSFLERLMELYKKGLERYLDIIIDDAYLSPLTELGFIDVYNEVTFYKNINILRSVVELLQPFKIKYTQKHQFLGDFFENLLNTGIKQEAGQFFTPVPLARFIVNSLPVREIILDKIRQREVNIFPYIIDYACGSGHFLTEAIDRVQFEIDRIDEGSLSGLALSKYRALKHDFLWAEEYVYGIEKDYRLAKTTKIATFLNGDGSANIITGDGLDDFYASSTYKGILKLDHPSNTLSRFDIVVSNPPFSIDGFKKDVPNGAKSFDLYDKCSFKSNEIECLFLERLSQLLKPGGVAGVIFPLSLLNSNNSIYHHARKLLLIHFDIVGLVELGSKTFSATTTNTVCCFLRKRDFSSVRSTLSAIRAFFLESTVDEDLEEAISDYVATSAISYEELRTILAEDSADQCDIIDLNDQVVKLLVHCLHYTNRTVLGFSGEGTQEQQTFLGYRFSQSKRREGLHLITDNNGMVQSMIYDPLNQDNPDKMSYWIRANFNLENIDTPGILSHYMKVQDTNSLIEPELTIANPSSFFMPDNEALSVSYSPFGDFIDEFECTDVCIGDWIDQGRVRMIPGFTYSKNQEMPFETNNKILTASNININDPFSLLTHKYRYLREEIEIPNELVPVENDLIISMHSGSMKHLGKIVRISAPRANEYIGGYLAILRPQNAIASRVLLYNLLSQRFRRMILGLRDQNINNLSANLLKSFPLKVPTDLERFEQRCLELE